MSGSRARAASLGFSYGRLDTPDKFNFASTQRSQTVDASMSASSVTPAAPAASSEKVSKKKTHKKKKKRDVVIAQPSNKPVTPKATDNRTTGINELQAPPPPPTTTESAGCSWCCFWTSRSTPAHPALSQSNSSLNRYS